MHLHLPAGDGAWSWPHWEDLPGGLDLFAGGEKGWSAAEESLDLGGLGRSRARTLQLRFGGAATDSVGGGGKGKKLSEDTCRGSGIAPVPTMWPTRASWGGLPRPGVTEGWNVGWVQCVCNQHSGWNAGWVQCVCNQHSELLRTSWIQRGVTELG